MNNKIFDEEYVKFYDLFNNQKDYSEESNFLEKVFEKYSNKKIKTILDLGCGTGIHANKLSLRGYQVTGMDISKEMIKVANSKKAHNSEFFIGDMSAFELNKKFDSCIAMFASMGYITKNRQIESFLDCVKKHLNPEGILIIDVWNGLCVMRELPTSRSKEARSGEIQVIRKSSPILDSINHICNIDFEFRVFNKKKLIKEYKEIHKVRFFFPQELRKYLEDSGFEILKICKSFELDNKVNENCWNMVLICRLKK